MHSLMGGQRVRSIFLKLVTIDIPNTHTTFKQIELKGPGLSGFEAN